MSKVTKDTHYHNLLVLNLNATTASVSDLTVSGNSSLCGAVTAKDDLKVNGNTTLCGNLEVQGDLNATKTEADVVLSYVSGLQSDADTTVNLAKLGSVVHMKFSVYGNVHDGADFVAFSGLPEEYRPVSAVTTAGLVGTWDGDERTVLYVTVSPNGDVILTKTLSPGAGNVFAITFNTEVSYSVAH